ncbi:MAG: dihydroorotate dehydrogenase-like protein [Candidatus Hodarchaeota archaeon]
MGDLNTTYMGLKLNNPIMVSSCGLSDSIDGVRKIASAGAGCVVLKSLFEEQMDMETRDIGQYIGHSWHTEAFDYVRNMGMQLGPNDYLKLIEDAKKAVSIPVIASLNCISPRWWSEYAKKLENAGADGLELNVAYLPSDSKRDSREVENIYYQIVEKIKEVVNIPVAVKVGPYFSSLASFAEELSRRGADALVLFNRFYQVDVDIEMITLKSGHQLSRPEEISLPLRWIALLYDRIQCDLAGSTGVHDGAGVIKILLAGARVVQICSTLYKNGLEEIEKILDHLAAWMKEHKFESIEQFRGKASKSQIEKPELWERLQYIKALVGIE